MELANELWLNVFEYLDASTLGICSQVNWQWRELSEQPTLWQRHFTHDFPMYGYFKVDQTSWKSLYKDHKWFNEPHFESDYKMIKDLKLINKTISKVTLVEDAIDLTPYVIKIMNKVELEYKTPIYPQTKPEKKQPPKLIEDYGFHSVLNDKKFFDFDFDVENRSESKFNQQWAVSLFSHVHDPKNPEQFYLVEEFCKGFDLVTRLKQYGTFTENQARFYIVELILALKQIHREYGGLGFLKASHLLLDAKGHLKVSLGDFGKITGYSYARNFQFNANKIKRPYDNTIGDKYTGMMEKSISWRNMRKSQNFHASYPYVPPELIIRELGEGDEFSDVKADCWFIGAFLYEMLMGFPPFIADNVDEMYHKIYHCEKSLQFYRYQMSGTAEDFIKNILCPVDSRLSLEQMQSHPFFRSVDWTLSHENSVVPIVIK